MALFYPRRAIAGRAFEEPRDSIKRLEEARNKEESRDSKDIGAERPAEEAREDVKE